ncbi:MAG: uridylate kinase, partial [Methanomicrobiales archaeon]|nr:uridylate kinase [Methanomicrobiales archaeon]
WNVTSDTITAWVAAALHLDVVLLKSVDGIRVNGELRTIVSSPVSCGEVDSRFIPFILNHGQTAYVVNGRDPEQIHALIEGKTLRGTVIKA